MGGFADRVKETTTTTGTGAITLAGTSSGFRTFNTAFGVGPEFYYCIVGGAEWEVGEAFLTNSTTMTRDLVYASSNSNTLVSFSAGTKDVFCTIPAVECTTRGIVMARLLGLAMP